MAKQSFAGACSRAGACEQAENRRAIQQVEGVAQPDGCLAGTHLLVAEVGLQHFTLSCGREERFSECDACLPRARTVHIFSQVALAYKANHKGLGATFGNSFRGFTRASLEPLSQRGVSPKFANVYNASNGHSAQHEPC